MSRVAVVLFNLGGPDGPDSVRPFLFNLFNDPAIIGLPGLARTALAALISTTRAKGARANYALMGGGSPLLKETEGQAVALEMALAARLAEHETRAFIAMRYWDPMTEETARAVEEFAPDHVVLLPLYPQFSTTTTGSSLKAWNAAYKGPGKVRTVCCWFEQDGLVDAHAKRIVSTWEAAGKPEVRVLFSAHGLPEKVIAGGDPYQWQIEQTCAAVAARLPDGLKDWRLCYQSRVGPMKWLGPTTPAAIGEAVDDGLGVLIDPVAFVSDHVETLVELDIEYAELAHGLGCPVYLRAPAAGIAADFIDGLAGVVARALDREGGTAPDGRACEAGWRRCGLRESRGAA